MAARIGAAEYDAAPAIDLDRQYESFAPRRPFGYPMAAGGEVVAHAPVDAGFHQQSAGDGVMRIEARREMLAGKLGRLDRFLHVHAELDAVEKKLQCPLILLI